MTINKNCYVCDFPLPYSKTRSGKYYCEKHHVCAVEKTKVLKKRGRKELPKDEKVKKEFERKEYKKLYNRDYYCVVTSEKRKDKKSQTFKSTHQTF